MGAMDDLISQGKVHYIAVSNHTANQIEEAMDALRRVAKDASRRIVAVQNPYNLIERNAVSKQEGLDERFFLEFCREKRIGIVPYFPLVSGLLTGRYRRDNIDMVQGKIIYDGMQERFLTDYNLGVVEMLDEFVREKGITTAQLSIAWLLTHEEVCSVIAGVTKMEHIEDNAGATKVELTEGDLKAIDDILEEAKLTKGKNSSSFCRKIRTEGKTKL